MQKSLQGLDNTTAEGTEAIDNVTDVLKTLGDLGSEATWVKDAEQKIKEAKRYLKTEFKSHVGREETCADHCTAHALGDTSDSNLQSICQHQHETDCEQCESLETVLKEIESEINRVETPEEHRWRLSHDYKLCLASIQGPVVRTPVSTNPGLNFNPTFFFLLSIALSRIIFSILFRVSNHLIVGKKSKTEFEF